MNDKNDIIYIEDSGCDRAINQDLHDLDLLQYCGFFSRRRAMANVRVQRLSQLD